MTFVEFQQIVKYGKSRSDCSSECINNLVERIEAQAHEGLPGDIFECGAWRCGATIAMAAAAEYYDTGKHVYAFDTWGDLPYGPDQQGFENFGNVSYEEVLQATTPFSITLFRGKHEETVPSFAAIRKTLGQEISLLFMDSDFYSSHLVCLRNFWPLIPHDGCVMFHDWSFPDVQQAIKDAVNEQEYSRYDLPHSMGMIVKRELVSSSSSRTSTSTTS